MIHQHEKETDKIQNKQTKAEKGFGEKGETDLFLASVHRFCRGRIPVSPTSALKVEQLLD